MCVCLELVQTARQRERAANNNSEQAVHSLQGNKLRVGGAKPRLATFATASMPKHTLRKESCACLFLLGEREARFLRLWAEMHT